MEKFESMVEELGIQKAPSQVERAHEQLTALEILATMNVEEELINYYSNPRATNKRKPLGGLSFKKKSKTAASTSQNPGKQIDIIFH